MKALIDQPQEDGQNHLPTQPPAAVAMLPEKSRQIALGRADLLRLYRRAAALAGAKRATAAKIEFVASYNLGAYPQLYAVVGEASRQSLERWDRTLRASGDPWDLAPRWGEHRRKQGFGAAFLKKLDKDGVKDLFAVLSGFPAENLLLAQALNPNRKPVAEAVHQAKEKMAAQELPLYSDATYTRFLEKFRDRYYGLWVGCREGEKAVNDKIAPYLVRDYDLLAVGDCLVADGHKFNFEILNPWTGKPQRMTLVLWFDMKASFPAGWEIMPTENTQAIAVAMRRAILMLGKIPRCAYLDNGKAFRSKHFNGTPDLQQAGIDGLFGRLGMDRIYAWKYHGESKTVERFFGILGEFERQMPTYVGRSIEEKPARLHMGEKHHRRLHQIITQGFVPSIIQVHRALALFFDRYARRVQRRGHLAGLTPAEVFEAGRGPGVDPEGLHELMMSLTVKRIGRNGIKLPGLGDYYHPELSGRRHPVVVRYDALSPDFILVHETSGKFICRAEPWGKVHPIARITGTAEDRQEVSAKIDVKRGVIKEAMSGVRALCEAVVVPEAKRLLSDQGLAGEPGAGAGVKDSLTVPRRRQAKIEYTPAEVERVERDLAGSDAGGVILEAEAAAVIELPEAVDQAELLYTELDAKGDVERYEGLMELEAQGYLLPKKYLLFMRYFEATDSYERQRDYYAERRAKLAVCFQVG